MAKGKAKKTEKTEKKAVEPYREPAGLSPFERMEHMFEDFFHKPFGWPLWSRLPKISEDFLAAPKVDIYEEGNDVVLKSEMPGMSKDDIEVNISDDTITLSGEKRKEEKTEKKDYHRIERSYGSFRRSFSLPSEVESSRAKASFKNGVLEVRMPKTEEALKKKRKISVE